MIPDSFWLTRRLLLLFLVLLVVYLIKKLFYGRYDE